MNIKTKFLTSVTTLAILTTTLLASSAQAATRGSFDGDGVLRFQYGSATPPVLTCSLENVCMITMKGGEKVFEEAAGDNVRWIIKPGVAGKNGDVPAIFFQPTDTCNRDAQTGRCNGPLQTNMLIVTNEHRYQIILKSDEYAKQTTYGFAYPRDEATGQSEENGDSHPIVAMQNLPVHSDPVLDGKEPATMLSMLASLHCDNYRIVGMTSYTPTKVCNDGIRTYVQIPESSASPTFQTVGPNGDSYLPTVHPPTNGIYTLDGVPNHIVIIGDIGRKVPHIDIFHNGAK